MILVEPTTKRDLDLILRRELWNLAQAVERRIGTNRADRRRRKQREITIDLLLAWERAVRGCLSGAKGREGDPLQAAFGPAWLIGWTVHPRPQAEGNRRKNEGDEQTGDLQGRQHAKNNVPSSNVRQTC